MKKTWIAICMAVLLLGAVGCNRGDGWFEPWDNLNGGGTASDGELSKESASDYAPDSDIDEAWKNPETTMEGAIEIDLSTITNENAPDGVKFEDGTLTIKEAGKYALSGSLVGNIVVKNTDDRVQLFLNGATISTPQTSANAALVFEKTSAERILTAVANTVNTLSDSVGDTDADGDGAVIQAKKCSLIVNGSGKLILKGVGEDATGLKVKKQLFIVDTQLEIEAVNHGIKANEKIWVYDADIKLNVGGDGMKTDMEATDQTEAAEYAADPEAGYIYIENTSLDITSGDDGISANNCLYFANNENNTVKIVTNGGAPNKVTESSSDNADGKALKAAGITLVEGDSETDVPASYEENYALVITGGNFDLNSNDDAITSKGNLIVSGGNFQIASGDDGLHAEYLTKISGGEITVSKSYEGVEGAAVEITGGVVNVVSTDDGINAANKDLRNYDFHIYIGGGTITVDAEGDGVDANGWIKMDGGDLTIYGPTRNDNGALDADNGFLMNGGNLCAIGSIGMVENPASNSEQCYISLNLSSQQKAGTVVEVYDDSETLLYTVTPKKVYQSVILSFTQFEQGKTYTVKVGSTTYNATLNSIGTALGTNQGGMGNQGGRPGPGGPGGGRW